MTDWEQLVSGEDLEKAASVRKLSVERKLKVKPEDIPGLESCGWRVTKTDKRGRATMEKDKPFFDVFENEVWMILSNPWREYAAFYKTGMNRHNF